MVPTDSRNRVVDAMRRMSLALLALALLTFAPTASTACGGDLHTSYLSKVPSYLAILDSLAAGADEIYGGSFRVCCWPRPSLDSEHGRGNGGMLVVPPEKWI